MRLGFSLILLLWSSGCGSYKPQDLIIGVWVVNVANSVQCIGSSAKTAPHNWRRSESNSKGTLASPVRMRWNGSLMAGPMAKYKVAARENSLELTDDREQTVILKRLNRD